MIDPVAPTTGVPPPQPASSATTGQAPAAAAPAQPAGADSSAAPAKEDKAPPPPVNMDVQRGQGGVFVYTLRDPATDVVLAVIPRAEVLTPSQGRRFDERV